MINLMKSVQRLPQALSLDLLMISIYKMQNFRVSMKMRNKRGREFRISSTFKLRARIKLRLLIR